MRNANQDKAPVRLIGVADGLRVTLDPARSAGLLRKELKKLFKPLKHLAINAKVTFDLGEQEGHDALVEELGEYLKEAFGVGSIHRRRKQQAVTSEVDRNLDMARSWTHHRSDVLMLAGRVRSGQKVSARKHLLILGDVNPGGEVVAGGDILILGSLGGIAAAGQPDREETIVLALDFRPTQIQIGPIMAAGLPASPRTFPEFAYVEDGVIVVEDYIKANPFGRMPWPEVR